MVLALTLLTYSAWYLSARLLPEGMLRTFFKGHFSAVVGEFTSWKVFLENLGEDNYCSRVVGRGEAEALVELPRQSMGFQYFRQGDQVWEVVLVPWLPGLDYTASAGLVWSALSGAHTRRLCAGRHQLAAWPAGRSGLAIPEHDGAIRGEQAHDLGRVQRHCVGVHGERGRQPESVWPMSVC